MTQTGEVFLKRSNDASNWVGVEPSGIDGNLGDVVSETVDWVPAGGGSYSPTGENVLRKDVAGTFRVSVGPSDEVTNVPVVSFAFDVPELIAMLPGTPVVVRVTFQVTVQRGNLQPQPPAPAHEHIYIDLSPFLEAVENVAEYAAIRSSVVHRGVVLFRGVLKKLNVKPVLIVQISTFFQEAKNPLVAFLSSTVDYLFTGIVAALPGLPPLHIIDHARPGDSDLEHDQLLESEDIPFSLRRGYLKYLLRACHLKQVRKLALEEEWSSEFELL